LIIILICLFGISNVHSQFSSLPVNGFSVSDVKMNNQSKAVATDGAVYFGYCDVMTGSVGVGQTAEMSASICMPNSISKLYAGKTITKIRIGLYNDCTNVSVWIRNSLDGTNVIVQTAGNVNKGWTEITLSTPFTIPANDFYIGYTATGWQQIGLGGIFYENLDNNNGKIWDSNSGWIDYRANVCIQALIDTHGENVFALSPESMKKSIQDNPNQNFTIQGFVRNLSTINITSVKVVYQIDNQVSVEKAIPFSIMPMKADSINILIDAIPPSSA